MLTQLMELKIYFSSPASAQGNPPLETPEPPRTDVSHENFAHGEERTAGGVPWQGSFARTARRNRIFCRSTWSQRSPVLAARQFIIGSSAGGCTGASCQAAAVSSAKHP